MEKKKTLCPVCGRRIMDAMENVHVDMASVDSIGDEAKWNPQILVKCWNCKKTIALKVS